MLPLISLNKQVFKENNQIQSVLGQLSLLNLQVVAPSKFDTEVIDVACLWQVKASQFPIQGDVYPFIRTRLTVLLTFIFRQGFIFLLRPSSNHVIQSKVMIRFMKAEGKIGRASCRERV